MNDAGQPRIHVAESQSQIEAAYAEAKQTETTYLAVEAAEDTWGVVYDLAPAGRSLDEDTISSLVTAVTTAVEAEVAAGGDKMEIGHSIGAEMGSLYGFETKASAMTVAETIRTHLDK